MDEIEVDLNYEALLFMMRVHCEELDKYNSEELRVVKVVDKPSKFPGNDRVTFYIDVV